MRNCARPITIAAVAATLVGALALAPTTASAQESSVVKEGKQLTFDRKKGNCLACHQIEGGNLAGDAGPPLVAIQARFPNKEALFNQIYDPTRANPDTFMPPFGRHGILSREEIRKIVEYVWTL